MTLEIARLSSRIHASPLTRIDDTALPGGIELWIKRDDRLHPIISGNKWRKLKYILEDALALGARTLVSMGGAHSNHLHALAFAAKALGLGAIGLVRGEAQETPTLSDCRNWGMALQFVSRSDYRALRQYREPGSLPGLEPGQYWLPEGGAQALALKGIAEMVAEIDIAFDLLCVPCGTGTTLAGCIPALGQGRKALGFAALKHADFLARDVESLLPQAYTNWQISHDYHGGGFAKNTPAQLDFRRRFEAAQRIRLEPLYTVKMLYGIYDMIAKGLIEPGQRIVAVHTGGLQGLRGFENAGSAP